MPLFKTHPYTTAFHDLFSQAGSNLVDATDLLWRMTSAGADARALGERLAEIERAGDELTREVYQSITTTFVTPFDRAHVHRLGSQLDQALDHVEMAGSLLVLDSSFQLPDRPLELVRQIADTLRSQAQATEAAVAELLPRGSLATFWAEREERLAGFWAESHRLHDLGIGTYRALTAELFSGDHDALSSIRLRELAEELRVSCDAFAQVSVTIGRIVARER